jgi:hypothetical protein
MRERDSHNFLSKVTGEVPKREEITSQEENGHFKKNKAM